MTAMKETFPKSNRILCSWHVCKNFEKLSLSHFEIEDDRLPLIKAVEEMIKSAMEEKFLDAVADYEEAAKKSCNGEQVFLDHLQWYEILSETLTIIDLK